MTTPPFAPPYKSRLDNDGAERWVQVGVDGSQTEVDAPPRVLEAIEAFTASKPAARPAKAGVLMLKVPYAEKDEAKALGAKWDATKRKWYVPAGVDQTPFERWSAGA